MDDTPEGFKISINLGVHNDKTHGQIPTNLPHKSVHVANVIVHPEYKGSTKRISIPIITSCIHGSLFLQLLKHILLVPKLFSVNPGQVTFDYDIAILELDEEVDLKIYTPACLANKGDKFIGQTATAAGWGYTDKEEKQKPDVPHEAQFPVGECGSGSGTDLLVCVDIVDGISLARVCIVLYLIVKVLCKQ